MRIEDEQTIAVIRKYSMAAAGAMIAIPVPGVDMAATYVVWGKMIAEIARIHGEELSAADARALAAELFKSAIFTAAAWFASAKTATFVLKFIPGAGTAAAYLVDAAIAAYGSRKITSALGFTAAAYFRNGRQIDPQLMAADIGKVLKDPRVLAALLGALRGGRRRG